MVGHLDVPGLTEPNTPASLSATTINGLLRDQLGFAGLVMTDDLSGMGAITVRYRTAQAVVTALQAGDDVTLLSFTSTGAITGILDAMQSAVETGSLAIGPINQALGRLQQFKPRRC
jgi:beta-N-acetylhexosaminidase